LADSLGWSSWCSHFEEAFEIDIQTRTREIRTVQDAVDYIERHTKK